METLYTRAEAAERLRISEKTLSRLPIPTVPANRGLGVEGVMDAGETIRSLFGTLLAPYTPWHYLWCEGLEHAISRVLDVVHGYAPGSGLWPLEAAFRGHALFTVRAFEGPRYAPPPPVLAVSSMARARSLHIKRGLVIYPAEEIEEAFSSAWNGFGSWRCVTVREWREARRDAKEFVRRTRPTMPLDLRPLDGQRLLPF